LLSERKNVIRSGVEFAPKTATVANASDYISPIKISQDRFFEPQSGTESPITAKSSLNIHGSQMNIE
jgi:hypothetical protein